MMDIPDMERVWYTQLCVYLLHPVAELCHLFYFFFGSVFCYSLQTVSPQQPGTLAWRGCLQRKHAHSAADTFTAGNSRADVLSPRFLSHPSSDLSPRLCESGWERPERDWSIRLLWQGWGWHLNPHKRERRDEDDKHEEGCEKAGRTRASSHFKNQF